MEKYFILNSDGFLQSISNEKPNKDVLFTTIDYADFVEDRKGIKYDFKNKSWVTYELPSEETINP